MIRIGGDNYSFLCIYSVVFIVIFVIVIVVQ